MGCGLPYMVSAVQVLENVRVTTSKHVNLLQKDVFRTYAAVGWSVHGSMCMDVLFVQADSKPMHSFIYYLKHGFIDYYVTKTITVHKDGKYSHEV